MSEETLFRGNTRVANLARWFRRVPEGAFELTVVVSNGDAGWETVARYPIDSVRPALASEIEDALQSYMEETRQTLTGHIRFLDERGETLTSRRLRVRFEGSTEEQFEGNAQSVLTQTQQHQQVLMNTLTGTVKYLVTVAATNQEEAIKRALGAEHELREAQAKIQELEDAVLAQDYDTSPSPTEERMNRMLELFIARAMQQGSKPQH